MRRRSHYLAVIAFLTMAVGLGAAPAKLGKAPKGKKAGQPPPAKRQSTAFQLIKGHQPGESLTSVSSLPGEFTYGKIKANVVDEEGKPLAGVKVSIHGMALSATTDDTGVCEIEKVPAASARYILKAEKEGFLPRHMGLVNVVRTETAVVSLLMEKETPEHAYLKESLWVKNAFLMEVGPREPIVQPDPDAVLDPSRYPPEVIPYLRDGDYITPSSDHVQNLAQQILASIPEKDRKKQTVVAKAVYDWIVQNITYDLMRNYGGDVTGGNWQTTYGGWGQGFNEWCYTPDEVLIEKRAICIEFERLAASLLRALEIPARSCPLFAHPVTQWYVQPAQGEGYWANFETSVGSTMAHDQGDLNARFPSRPDVEIGLIPVNADIPIQCDWHTENRGIYVEDYGQGTEFEKSEEGLKMAREALEKFAETGTIPQAQDLGAIPIDRGTKEPHYQVRSRGFVIELANLGDQKIIESKFPYSNGPARKAFEARYWTNHPEWVKESKTLTQTDEETKLEMKWHHVTFEVGPKK